MTEQDKKDLCAILKAMHDICFRRANTHQCAGCPFFNKKMRGCTYYSLLDIFALYDINLTQLWKRNTNETETP